MQLQLIFVSKYLVLVALVWKTSLDVIINKEVEQCFFDDLYNSKSAVQFACAAVFKKLRDLGGLCLGELSAAPTELTFGTTVMFVSYNDHERQVSLVCSIPLWNIGTLGGVVVSASDLQ